MLVFGDFAFGFIAANLLVECIEKLLAGGSAGKRGAMVQRAAKAAEIEQAFRCAVEGDAHAIQQIDNPRRSLTHGLNWRLVGNEITAVDRVVKVLPGGIAFTFEIFGGIDAALSAYRMRPLDRHNREQIDVAAGFSNLDSAASPASPPPTTIIFGVVTINLFNHKGHEGSRRNASAPV